MNIVSNNEKCASLCICFAVPFSYTISNKAQNFYFIDIIKKTRVINKREVPGFYSSLSVQTSIFNFLC